MGKRRIRLLQEMYPDFNLYGVDEREDRRREANRLFGCLCLKSISDAAAKYEIHCAFVCTSPLYHNGIIKECLGNKWNIFTELNLISDGYQENIESAKKNECILFLSSTFLYREEIRYIREYVNHNQRWNYIYHIGQYLPDWHPWENYKDFFVGDKRTNGCREIMAIEFPWLIKTFGDIEKFQIVSDKITTLNIDYHDNYMIQFIHKNGNKGTVMIDIVSPVAVRKLEVYAENKYIQWNGTPDSLYEYDQGTNGLRRVILNEKEEHKEGYRNFIVENAYRNEIKEFIEVVENGKEPVYGFEEDLITLNLIDSVEDKAWMN